MVASASWNLDSSCNGIFTGGTLQGDARLALFRLNGDEVLESRVFIKADRVSPFDLAASWRAYQENLQPSTVRGILDVSINAVPEADAENGSSASLELDLEHYVVPAPTTSANAGLIYAANMKETPRSLIHLGIFSNADSLGGASNFNKDAGVAVDHPATINEMEVIVPDPSKVYSGSGMVESKSVGTFSPLQKQDHRGLSVDRGVGSPRLVKSASAAAGLSVDRGVGSPRLVKSASAAAGLSVDRGVGSPRLVKLASAAAFTAADLKLDSETKNAFPVDEAHEISISDIRLANVNRHARNILMSNNDDGRTVLIPIDHEYCFPESEVEVKIGSLQMENNGSGEDIGPVAVAVSVDSPTPTVLPERFADDSQTPTRPWKRVLFGLFHFGLGVMQCGGALLGQAFVDSEQMSMGITGISAIIMLVVSSVLTVVRPWFDGEPASWTEYCCSIIFTLIGFLVPFCAVLVGEFIIRFVVLIVILAVTLIATGVIAGLLSKEHVVKVCLVYCLLAVVYFVFAYSVAMATG